MFVSRVASSDAPTNQPTERKNRWRCRVFDCCRVSFTASHQSQSTVWTSKGLKHTSLCYWTVRVFFPPTEKTSLSDSWRRWWGRRWGADNPEETSEEVTRLFSHLLTVFVRKKNTTSKNKVYYRMTACLSFHVAALSKPQMGLTPLMRMKLSRKKRRKPGRRKRRQQPTRTRPPTGHFITAIKFIVQIQKHKNNMIR